MAIAQHCDCGRSGRGSNVKRIELRNVMFLSPGPLPQVMRCVNCEVAITEDFITVSVIPGIAGSY